MSDVAVEQDREPTQFGHLQSPTLPGLGRLPVGASVFLILAAGVMMLLAIRWVWLALAWAALSAVLLLPTLFPTREGFGRYELAWRRVRHGRAAAAGTTVLRQGSVGAAPDGLCRLPGFASKVELTSHVDGWGREFGLLHYPDPDLYAVVLLGAPAGFAGLDQGIRDSQVAQWAHWQAGLSSVEELVGMAVVIETVPDSGQRLERAMERGRVSDDRLTPFARAVEQAILSSSREGSPSLTVRITLTLTARVREDSDGGSREWVRPVEDMAAQFADLLPGWTSGLAPTGAGHSVRPATAQEIVDATRVAFDPSVAVDVEEAQLSAAAARAAGERDWQRNGTGLTWEQAGPIYSDATRLDEYIHEHHVSRTMQMYSPPAGIFFAESIRPLLEQHRDIERKRVTLLYRPESAAKSTVEAQRAVTAARFRLSQSRNGNAAAQEAFDAAQQTAKQTAKGSPLVRVAMLVTVSASDMDSLRKASRRVRTSLAGAARIGLRVPRGSQDWAFLCALPLGVVPQVTTRPPRRSRGAIETGRLRAAARAASIERDTLGGVLDDPWGEL